MPPSDAWGLYGSGDPTPHISKAARISRPWTGVYASPTVDADVACKINLLTSHSATNVIDLTESPPRKSFSPKHAITVTDPFLISDEVRTAIATVPEQQLRCAILKLCTESAEAASLLGPLLIPSALGGQENKRKRSLDLCDGNGEDIDDDSTGWCKARRIGKASEEADAEDSDAEICDNCGEEVDDDGAGCCKSRMMSLAREQAEADELETLESVLGSGETCDNCGEDINDDDDGCCKYRRMQMGRMESLRRY
ncbi:hypothetical protein VTL71DRAFT_14683 [Oculimacula yallundae]|uniref:Uncharacterized protein n=1 Tax=Oculimacula yallundae TaxID=86028 RepID=A0ABR4CJB5_9HELO